MAAVGQAFQPDRVAFESVTNDWLCDALPGWKA
jgi:hypothetical protein